MPHHNQLERSTPVTVVNTGSDHDDPHVRRLPGRPGWKRCRSGAPPFVVRVQRREAPLRFQGGPMKYLLTFIVDEDRTAVEVTFRDSCPQVYNQPCYRGPMPP